MQLAGVFNAPWRAKLMVFAGIAGIITVGMRFILAALEPI